MKALAGRRAVVTGALGGLGRAVVEVLTAEGATVRGIDVRETADLVADLADPRDIERVVGQVEAQLGGIDVLVLNAGIQDIAPVADLELERWDALQGVMVRGPFLTLQAAWGALARSGRGRVVAVGSTNSLLADPGKAAYTAAKHGLVGLIKTSAQEGAEVGITANVVAPGWMRTPLAERQLPDAEEAGADGPLGRHWPPRWIEPREVAEVVAFLASDRASAVTGAVIPVDLGYLAG